MPVPQTTIRLNDEDRALVADLKQRYGLTSTTQLIRLALRLLAERRFVDSDNDSFPNKVISDDRTPKP